MSAAKHIQMSQTGSKFTKYIADIIGSNLCDICMLEQHKLSDWNNVLNVRN